MMGALIAGGMVGNYDAKHDAQMIEGQECMEYAPNPKGFFEVIGPDEWWERRGMVTKVPLKPLRDSKRAHINEGKRFRIVVMRRPVAHRKASLRAWGYWTNGAALDYKAGLAEAKRRLPRAQWIEVDYDDLVDDPQGVVTRLRGLGWPVTNERGFCDWIEPALRRNGAR